MSQVNQDSELPGQAEKAIEAFSDFTLASNYLSFNTIEEFSLTDLPESPLNTLTESSRNALIESPQKAPIESP
ncbi:hypothetical protein F8M41_005943 [Gigaspora margarita]|uniref:Uncharacterized protein n=1 Tax=Gigaspora margarita TaxID=4874 RepID=A0A8H3X789_GIGMA|nr:hypothetical protein F8M41_005943 [Gigaspora margarita]